MTEKGELRNKFQLYTSILLTYRLFIYTNLKNLSQFSVGYFHVQFVHQGKDLVHTKQNISAFVGQKEDFF